MKVKAVFVPHYENYDTVELYSMHLLAKAFPGNI
jgi:hypothetical protein